MFIKIGTTLTAVVFSTSCADSAKTSPAASTASTGSTLEGVTWGSCKSTTASATATASSYKSSINFNGGIATSTVSTYSAAGCSDANKTTTVRFTGTYVIGQASTEVTGATNLDIVYDKQFVTLAGDPLTRISTAKDCGKSDWAKDIEVDITVLPCKLITVNVPSSSYLVYKVENKSLYSGQPDATNDGKSAAKRAKVFPTEPLSPSK